VNGVSFCPLPRLPVMVPENILAAFGGESRRLSEVVGGLDDAAFARPTPCDPWTVAELVCHVAMTMRRLPGMLAPPEPAGAALVPAAGYYRADQRFSAATNADRIESAQRGAAALSGAGARARDFGKARQRAWVALRAAPPGRVVQTRHGDLMLPSAAATRLRAETGWDQLTLIAGLTGRRPVTPAETQLIHSAGVGWLALG
jgi:uncharacterized protein (TIGR03083 family)